MSSSGEKDPVCGMNVDPRTARAKFEHGGRTYWFCREGCRAAFEAAPDRYLRVPQADLPVVKLPGARRSGADGEYTCPMHPEVVQRGPGSCPICGMALEPRVVSVTEDENPELVDMRRRFWIALVLTVPVFVIAMSEMIPGQALHQRLGARVALWVQLALATPVVLGCGWPLLVRGWESVRRRRLNMFTLIAIGTMAAWSFSVVATLVPERMPAEFRGHGGGVPVYFEAAAVITTLVLLGQVLELQARKRTSNALRELLGLAPKTARRVGEDGVDEDVPLEAVVVGDRLRVRPGERVPVDGVVV